MANRSKRLGTDGENGVVDYLVAEGFPHVERRALRGSKDCGDIAGLPGVVIEVKNTTTLSLAEFIKETELERQNAGADIAVCWHKRKGKGSAGDWYVTMTGKQFAYILKELGYC